MKKLMTAVLCAVVLAGCGAVEDAPAGTDPRETEARTEVQPEESQEETAPARQGEAEKREVLSLAVSRNELTPGEDSGEVIWYAEVMPEYGNPQAVSLIDADTGETVTELLDVADYENCGDTIGGDGVYTNRFTVDLDIDTDPEVSEMKTYRYYASFREGDTEYVSAPVEITVIEQFTDRELDNMETVSAAVEELMGEPGFREADIDTKREKVVALLTEYEERGMVDKGSICPGDEVVSYSVAGAGCGVMLRDLDPRMN